MKNNILRDFRFNSILKKAPTPERGAGALT